MYSVLPFALEMRLASVLCLVVVFEFASVCVCGEIYVSFYINEDRGICTSLAWRGDTSG